MEEIIFDDYDECEPEKKSEVKVCENHRYSICSSGINRIFCCTGEI